MSVYSEHKVLLRELTKADVKDVFAITSDTVGGKFMRYGAHTDISQASQLIEKYSKKPNMAFAVEDELSGDFLGYIGLDSDGDGVFSMSMMMGDKSRGKGIGTVVISKIKAMADRNENGIKKLTAHVVGDNTASRRMLEKNGFLVREKLVFDDLPQGLYVYEYPNK